MCFIFQIHPAKLGTRKKVPGKVTVADVNLATSPTKI